MKVGFIGVGMMGGPMCGNLIKKGHQAVIFDLNKDAIARMTGVGATAAGSPKEVAEQVDIVFTSLPMPADVEKVIMGPDGLAAGAKKGTIIADMSTNAPAVVQRLAKELAAKGIVLIDSPVSGGVDGAEAASLAIMCSGDKAAFDKVKPLLECMGKNVFHLGAIGMGNVAKLVNNMVSFCNLVTACEAMALAKRAGLDPDVMAGVMQTASGDSSSLKRVKRKAIRGDFKQEFALNLAYKDLMLALDLGRETGTPLSIGSHAMTLMQNGRSKDRGKDDVCTLMQSIEEGMNDKIRSKVKP
jgi:3-hydroxyisobutyrate dehydrogenase-like beta-hydroxyacid dehydrogenase